MALRFALSHGFREETTVTARGIRTHFALVSATERIDVRVESGVISTAAPSGTPAFSLHAPDEVWESLLAPTPHPGWQSLLHLVRIGSMDLQGDEREFARTLPLVRAVIERLRGTTRTPHPPRKALAAQGSYTRVHSALGTADIYVERAGTGPALLALATAGSNTTQWHGVMTDTDLCDRHELVTIDLPWHGRSSPIFGTEPGEWMLTPALYTDFLVEATTAIGLERPVLVGASMAGAAVVHALATNPEHFSGGVACQVAEDVHHRGTAWLCAPDIDQSTFVPEWTYGLMNPASPRAAQERVWWGYSSGGHGLYAADIDSYLRWRFDEVASSLTATSPHLALLSGVYDTSVTPAQTRALAARIPNSSFAEMPELGHFPHAENPAAFVPHLDAALQRVRTHPGDEGRLRR